MHSASAGPAVLLHVADSMPALREIEILAPGQVTEISVSPGLQVRRQVLLGPQVARSTKRRPLDPAGPGGPGEPAGPLTPCGPAGPRTPELPCGPTGPCGPFEHAAKESAAMIAIASTDARTGPSGTQTDTDAFTAAMCCQCTLRYRSRRHRRCWSRASAASVAQVEARQTPGPAWPPIPGFRSRSIRLLAECLFCLLLCPRLLLCPQL